MSSAVLEEQLRHPIPILLRECLTPSPRAVWCPIWLTMSKCVLTVHWSLFGATLPVASDRRTSAVFMCLPPSLVTTCQWLRCLRRVWLLYVDSTFQLRHGEHRTQVPVGTSPKRGKSTLTISKIIVILKEFYLASKDEDFYSSLRMTPRRETSTRPHCAGRPTMKSRASETRK